jgi:RNA polymerase sigma-70 factor (ECF subfamily)
MIPILRLLRAAAGSDRDLLDRYVRNRDEAAFEALVRRYGTGVWAACVRLAGRDAEDAFQAVFLTLSRKAGTVTGSLPAWLHAVTRRVASTLRRSARRRTAIEETAARPDLAPTADPSLREGLALLDEELSRLPEQYRAVLIVCCLEGRSRDEAAEQLGWSEGQVKGLLERARTLLRTRLARRGVELGGLLLAAAATGPIPVRANPPSASAVTLTHGVIRAMMIQKLKLAVAVLTACVGVALAGGVVLRAQPGDPLPAGPNGAANASNVPKEPPEKRATAEDKGIPSSKEIDESAKKVKELRKERITTLKDLVEGLTVLYRNARIEYGELLDARMLLLQAELDAAEKGADRIALYEKAVDSLKQYEELANAKVRAGRAPGTTVLGIKARRLEVEIQLEQAKAKEAKERK